MVEYRIGIDPGLTGALALLEYNGEWPKLVEVVDMPIMALGTKSQQVNAVALTRQLQKWESEIKQVVSLYKLVAFVEQVQSMPGQGVSSMFNFGMGYGIIQGVVEALKIPVIFVRPAAWKKKAGLLHADKDLARTKAIQIFPEADLNLKKHIGRADAILIAVYGYAGQLGGK